ncbi:thioredoxin family protein [Brochothrix thermosphacta]|uniref:thioredoxin family protein n=1 Tax=Brochothrix thermosphacta TaxID=2756 RepID=UPI003F98B118
MKEWSTTEFKAAILSKSAFAVLFYTSMCGGCQLVERYLHFAEAAMPEVQIVKMNVNYLPEVIAKYEIKSVPSIYVFSDDMAGERLSAIDNVTRIYEGLEKLRN